MVLSNQLPGILWKSQHLLPHLQQPTIYPIPSHINQVHAIKFNLFAMHFNIILQSNPKSSKQSRSLRFSKKYLRKQVSFPTCSTSLRPSFQYPNIIFWEIPHYAIFVIVLSPHLSWDQTPFWVSYSRQIKRIYIVRTISHHYTTDVTLSTKHVCTVSLSGFVYGMSRFNWRAIRLWHLIHMPLRANKYKISKIYFPNREKQGKSLCRETRSSIPEMKHRELINRRRPTTVIPKYRPIFTVHKT
jgi:hypothetical protein